MTSKARDWKELCEAASKERDSEQLRVLISELVDALDERRVATNRGELRDRIDAA